MADATKIVQMNITRQTQYPSDSNFGIAAIIANFEPGNLNTDMQGQQGRYKKYVSLSNMTQDGWSEDDPIYLAAFAYFSENPNPGTFIVGLKKTTDASWTEALTAVNDDYSNWYGFSVIMESGDDLNDTAEEIAEWAETLVKIFFLSTSQVGVIGILELASAGYYTSGKLGALANFTAVTKGYFNISKDGAAAVEVNDINLSSVATAGIFETGDVTDNLAALIAVSDGEFSLDLDGGGAADVAGIDLTGETTFAEVAAAIQTAVQLEVGLTAVTVTYSSTEGRFIFTSDSTGASSSLVVAIAAAPSGTDLTGATLLNGGTSIIGTAGSAITDFDGIATALTAAIVAAGVTGVVATYAGARLVFTSDTEDTTSIVTLTSNDSEDGVDLLGVDYMNGGSATYGTDLGKTPGTDDLGTVLSEKLIDTKNLDNTVIIFHDKARDKANIAATDVAWIEYSWMSQSFVKDPASITWAYKGFDEDIIPVVGLSNAQDEFARSNNVNTYTLTSGRNTMLDGKVIGGEYIDIIRGTAWFEALMVSTVFDTIYDNDKIPFTDVGITLMENSILSVFSQAEINLLDGLDTVLNVPTVDDVTPENRANRTLDKFTFSARYQGAIHNVIIEGTIGV